MEICGFFVDDGMLANMVFETGSIIPSASSKSAVPTWLRVAFVLAVVVFWYASQRGANVEPKPAPPAAPSNPVVVDVGETDSAEEKSEPADAGESREAQADGDSEL